MFTTSLIEAKSSLPTVNTAGLNSPRQTVEKLSEILPWAGEQQISEQTKEFSDALQKKLDEESSSHDLSPVLKILDSLYKSNNLAKRELQKKHGYLSRLFSNETWDEWLENRTPLGRVIASFSYFVDSPYVSVSKYINQLDRDTIERATAEARGYLKTQSVAQGGYNGYYEIMVAQASSFWLSICNIMSFSLLPQANAQDNQNLVDPLDAIAARVAKVLKEHEFDYSKATPEQIKAYSHVVERTIEQFHDGYDRVSFNQIQKKIYEGYKASHDEERKKYKAALDDHSYENGFYAIIDEREPQLTYMKHITGNRETTRLLAVPGYISWAIYYDGFGPDWFRTPYAKGELNYDTKKNQPTVPNMGREL